MESSLTLILMFASLILLMLTGTGLAFVLGAIAFLATIFTLGPQALIGGTCHASLQLAERALIDGASYIAFGRFFNSVTKPGAPAATPALLREARQQFSVPIVAIGGITLDNASTLLDAGADYLAVINGLFGAPDAETVQQRARQFSQLIHAS